MVSTIEIHERNANHKRESIEKDRNFITKVINSSPALLLVFHRKTGTILKSNHAFNIIFDITRDPIGTTRSNFAGPQARLRRPGTPFRGCAAG